MEEPMMTARITATPTTTPTLTPMIRPSSLPPPLDFWPSNKPKSEVFPNHNGGESMPTVCRAPPVITRTGIEQEGIVEVIEGERQCLCAHVCGRLHGHHFHQRSRGGVQFLAKIE